MIRNLFSLFIYEKGYYFELIWMVYLTQNIGLYSLI